MSAVGFQAWSERVAALTRGLCDDGPPPPVCRVAIRRRFGAAVQADDRWLVSVECGNTRFAMWGEDADRLMARFEADLRARVAASGREVPA